MAWRISEDFFSVLYYFNDEKTDLKKMLELLNFLAIAYNLSQFGWKLLFRVKVFNSETWNSNYFMRIEFFLNFLVF